MKTEPTNFTQGMRYNSDAAQCRLQRINTSKMPNELPDAGETAVNQRFSEIKLCIFQSFATCLKTAAEAPERCFVRDTPGRQIEYCSKDQKMLKAVVQAYIWVLGIRY